jgi:ADP-heptose:LPS heptosyltransferase
MTVLVIRLSALGDVAMTIPAVYSVARAYPQHKIIY